MVVRYAQFEDSTELPLMPHRTIAVIARVAIVPRWQRKMPNATPLDSRIPKRQMQEKSTRIKTVSKAAEKGRLISPARYPPALPAETTAYTQLEI